MRSRPDESLRQYAEAIDGYALDGHEFQSRYRNARMDELADAVMYAQRLPAAATLPGAQHAAWLSFEEYAMQTQNVLFTKLSPRNLDASALAAVSPFFAPADGGFDLWFGSQGWRTASHYDFQGNFYVQLSGEKHIVLADVDASFDLASFPYLHARYRQLRAPLLLDRPGDPQLRQQVRGLVAETILREGMVLYIPPLYMHTATALSNSTTSLSLCFVSREDEADLAMDRLPLPFDAADPEPSDGAAALRAYFGALLHACGLCEDENRPGCVDRFLERVRLARHVHLCAQSLASRAGCEHGHSDLLRQLEPALMSACERGCNRQHTWFNASKVEARASEFASLVRRLGKPQRMLLLANYMVSPQSPASETFVVRHGCVAAGDGDSFLARRAWPTTVLCDSMHCAVGSLRGNRLPKGVRQGCGDRLRENPVDCGCWLLVCHWQLPLAVDT